MKIEVTFQKHVGKEQREECLMKLQDYVQYIKLQRREYPNQKERLQDEEPTNRLLRDIGNTTDGNPRSKCANLKRLKDTLIGYDQNIMQTIDARQEQRKREKASKSHASLEEMHETVNKILQRIDEGQAKAANEYNQIRKELKLLTSKVDSLNQQMTQQVVARKANVLESRRSIPGPGTNHEDDNFTNKFLQLQGKYDIIKRSSTITQPSHKQWEAVAPRRSDFI